MDFDSESIHCVLSLMVILERPVVLHCIHGVLIDHDLELSGFAVKVNAFFFGKAMTASEDLHVAVRRYPSADIAHCEGIKKAIVAQRTSVIVRGI